MKQIIYNSFPRSGNVYSGQLSDCFFYSMYATVHIPEIFSVKELDNVTVFRKPSDAISSLINKQSPYMPEINKKEIKNVSFGLCKLYQTYIKYAKINKDLIYIAKFEDLITDTVKHFENISKKFNRNLVLNYKNKFESVKFSGKLWDDVYDGHLPRNKNNTRIFIEENINLLTHIQELNKEYEEFINIFSTKIN